MMVKRTGKVIANNKDIDRYLKLNKLENDWFSMIEKVEPVIKDSINVII